MQAVCVCRKQCHDTSLSCLIGPGTKPQSHRSYLQEIRLFAALACFSFLTFIVAMKEFHAKRILLVMFGRFTVECDIHSHCLFL